MRPSHRPFGSNAGRLDAPPASAHASGPAIPDSASLVGPPAPHQHLQEALTMPSRRAATQVLQNYELLEMVLSRLDITSVVRAQRLHSTWRTIIQRSKSIRRSMFLDPQEPHRLLEWRGDCANWKDNKPFITHDTVETAAARAVEFASYEECEDPGPSILTTLHPALGPQPLNAKRVPGDTTMDITIAAGKICSWKPGPWEDMLMMQPPCMRTNPLLLDLHCETGLTLGMLRDEMKFLQVFESLMRAGGYSSECAEKRSDPCLREWEMKLRIEGFLPEGGGWAVEADLNGVWKEDSLRASAD